MFFGHRGNKIATQKAEATETADFWRVVEQEKARQATEILGAIAVFNSVFNEILGQASHSKSLNYDEQGSRVTLFQNAHQKVAVICHQPENVRTKLEIAPSSSGVGSFVMSIVTTETGNREAKERVVEFDYSLDPVPTLIHYSDTAATPLSNQQQPPSPASSVNEVSGLIARASFYSEDRPAA